MAAIRRVSVIVPIRNEKESIPQCIESIVLTDYPKEFLEVLLVDGRSDDGTREVIPKYAERHPFIRMLDNPNRTVPYAMNLGIQNAMGDVIIRMDAHASYEKDYISRLVYSLYELDADNVGGSIVTIPESNTAEARAVSIILSNSFGVGNSYFRIGSDCIREVDTVPFGCYRREVFDRIGLYDETLIRNQDDEFNARLKKNGGKIYLIPDVRIRYTARGKIRQMVTMLFQYGYFKPLVNIRSGGAVTIRQFVPPFFAAFLILSGGLAPLVSYAFWAFVIVFGTHCTVNAMISVGLAARNGWTLFPYFLVGFLSAHLSYGVGYLIGIKDFVVFKRHQEKRKTADIGLSR